MAKFVFIYLCDICRWSRLDTVVEELVNRLNLTPARSTPVEVLLNESQVSNGTPDGTEEIIEGDFHKYMQH